MAKPTYKPIRRRRLGKRLEELRLAAGLDLVQAGVKAGLAKSTIWRYEQAETRIPVKSVHALCNAYEVDPVIRERLVDLARRIEEYGWWNQFGGATAEWFEDYLALEADAGSMWTYESELIPGLLQTEEYAVEATSRMWPTSPIDEETVRRRVEVRLLRQKAAFDRPKPLEMWAGISEGALRRVVKNPETMAEQLDHLIDMARRPNIMVQVIPFTQGAHAGMLSPFVILNFPVRAIDPSVVYLEQRTSSLYLEGTEDVEAYTLSVEQLRAWSLDPDQSVELIGAIASDLARST